MALGKRKRYTPKTGRNKRRRRFRRKLAISPRERYTPFIMPNKWKCKLRYFEIFSLNPGAGTADHRVFSATGLYDPDITGAGHQPRGFDQIMQFYNHYVVIGSKATLRFMPIGATNANTSLFGISLNDSATAMTSSTLEDFMETKFASKRKGIAGLVYQGSYTKDAMVTKTFSHKKFFRKPANDTEFQGTASSNPTDQAYFTCSAYSPDEATDSGAVNYHVVIDYICLFTEPKLVPVS
ncbi:MAG: putative capsid protein [Cressdnaviricota sp.]|nr:MAG: putative capsid protein [Cressdnaviricota sp.]